MKSQYQNSIDLIESLLTDYVRLLEEDHPTVARLTSAQASAAVRNIQVAQVPPGQGEDGDSRTQ